MVGKEGRHWEHLPCCSLAAGGSDVGTGDDRDRGCSATEAAGKGTDDSGYCHKNRTRETEPREKLTWSLVALYFALPCFFMSCVTASHSLLRQIVTQSTGGAFTFASNKTLQHLQGHRDRGTSWLTHSLLATRRTRKSHNGTSDRDLCQS